eukprot:SAG25_NODE_1478_length_2942_cov_11.625747_3_plen_118_part_00
MARSLSLRPGQVSAALSLLDSGCTVPFVVRYRQAATGGLDEHGVRAVQAAAAAHRELLKARQKALAAIDANAPCVTSPVPALPLPPSLQSLVLALRLACSALGAERRAHVVMRTQPL